jgi:hypothetical protein
VARSDLQPLLWAFGFGDSATLILASLHCAIGLANKHPTTRSTGKIAVYILRSVKATCSHQRASLDLFFRMIGHSAHPQVRTMHPMTNLKLVLAGALCVPAVISAQRAGTVPNHASMVTPDSAAVRSLLTSPLGSRGPSGSALLSGQTLRIDWTGDQPGSARTWSVRRGSCARDQGAFNESEKFAPLVVNASGTASASAVLASPAPSGNVYLVVRSSSTDPEPVVLACGSLLNVEASEGVMDHSAMDHSAMDHSRMAMGAANARVEIESAGTSEMNMVGAANDSLYSRLMAIHTRMMADPVIRERVLTDPVLQRMIGDTHAESSPMHMTGTEIAPKTPMAKSTAKRAVPSKPSAKPAPKPATPAMPGMDHGKMPGMKKPPV